MKASEMMDNDLIRYGGHLCRFVISAMSAYVERLSDGATFPPCACVEAESIPLTEEILKLNGFREEEWDEGDLIRCGTNGKRSYVSYFEPQGCRTYFYLRGWSDKPKEWKVYNNENMKIRFVHEFQHALRLCGLNDFADNFKIK